MFICVFAHWGRGVVFCCCFFCCCFFCFYVCVIVYLGSDVHVYVLTTTTESWTNILSVKYINRTCWLKLLSILRGFCCCLFNVCLPLCVWSYFCVHLFTGLALFSLTKRAGGFTFIVFLILCVWSLCPGVCWVYSETILFVLWLEGVRSSKCLKPLSFF